ncbi:MAG: hypothetical protein LBS81_06355 [Endomicrobium sp.]|jgi:hypothetical protein|nr:hypothetical protein [Endomicrobium sp.]
MRSLTEKEKSVLDLIVSDNFSLDYFFRESSNPHFLKILFKKGYFNDVADKETDSKDTKQFKIWPPVLYLLKISKNTARSKEFTNNIKEVSGIIVNIIKNISNKRMLEKGKSNKYNNYNLFYIFSKISANLDISFIDDELISYFPMWLEIDATSNMAPDELSKIIDKLLNIPSKQNIKKLETISLILLNHINNTIEKKTYAFNNGGYFMYDYFLKKDKIKRIAKLCSLDFILNISRLLSNSVSFKNHIDITRGSFRFKLHKNEDSSLKLSIDFFEIKYKTELNLPYFNFKEKDQIKEIINKKIAAPKINKSLKEKAASTILYYYFDIWKDMSCILFPSLFRDTVEIYYDNPMTIFIGILKEILNEKIKILSKKDFLYILNSILKQNKDSVFKRFQLYFYGFNFINYREDFWDLLEYEKELLFSDSSYEAELYGALNENTTYFTEDEKNRIENLIEKGPYENIDWADEGYNKNYTANFDSYKKYWQKRWYSTLKASPHFKKKYNLISKEKEFFNFRDAGLHVVVNKSPFKEKDVLKWLYNNPEKFLNEVELFEKLFSKEKKGSMRPYPSPSGISEQLRKISKENPDLVAGKLSVIAKLKPHYIKNIFYGFKEVKGVSYSVWNNIFSFIKTYLYILDGNKLPQDEKKALLSSFANLIQSFKKENGNIDKAIGISCSLINQLMPSYKQISSEEDFGYINTALNTYTGRAVKTIIHLSVEYSIQDKNSKSKDLWEPRLKQCYISLLDKNISEAHIFFGYYFRNFWQLEKEWAFQKQKEIFSSVNNMLWEMFFDGFLGACPICIEYYKEMHSHYKRAVLKSDTKRQKTLHILAHCILAFYLAGADKFENENSLIITCFKHKKFPILTEIVARLGSNEYSISETDCKEEIETAPLITAFFNYFSEIYKNQNIFSLTEEEKEFSASLIKLIPALTELSESIYLYINKIIEDMDKYCGNAVLNNILYLANKKETKDTVRYLGELFICMIKKMEYLFSFPGETLDNILYLLSAHKHFELINSIRTVYTKNQDYSKKDIFNKYIQ